ncbi:MAG: hypothetical protein K9N11_00465 [Lentisphaeria bacterium]|nr:hypothetical protein [Candidatus Neomarinimicrobiota bacterium]MCF7841299.1 hypothetical protein [Lentisphaeria bacterium]
MKRKNKPVVACGPVVLTDELFRADIVRWLPDVSVGTFNASADGAREQVRRWRKAGYQHFILLFNPVDTPGENQPVTDQINLTYDNPLIGTQEDIFGNRFPDMSDVYTVDKKPAEPTVVVMGHHKGLETFRERVWPVRGGIYEAIAIKASGGTSRGWLVSQLEDLYSEILNLTEVLCNAEV